MRTRAAWLAGAVAAIGLGALALPGRPSPPAFDGVTVVSGPAQLVQPPITRPSRQVIAPSAPTPAPVPAAPKPYPYWDGGDPGVWATPAEFSAPE